MPPRGPPRDRSTPVRRTNRRTGPGATRTSTPEGTPEGATTIPPVLINPTQMQTLLAQGIATALATYQATQNESSGQSANLGANLTPNPTNPKHCSYKDFLVCKPQNFTGAEGVIGVSQWIEKMETVFRVCSCPEDSKVKYATCTLLKSALTWWNDHATSMGHDTAYAMNWKAFKEMMIAEYCPRQEIQALEQELWGLTMKGSEVIAYTSRFNDLANLCPLMVNPEHRKTERYIWGLASPVQGLVTAAEPGTYDRAKQLAYRLTEQCIHRGTMNPQTKSHHEDAKRKSYGDPKENNKRYKSNPTPTAAFAAITDSEPTTAYAAIANTPTNIPAPSRNYVGKSPLCPKCNFHHTGNCMFCDTCNQRGHTSNYCKRASTATQTAANANVNAEGVRLCFKCNQPGHFMRNCPQLRNQGGPGRAFVIGTGGSPTLRDFLE